MDRFSTETAAMRTFTLSPLPQGDRSFRIGVIFILLFAAAELFSVSFYYLRGTRVATHAPMKPSASTMVAPSAPPLRLASPAPTVAPASVLAEPERLLKDAVALRAKGDTTTALAKLQEASQRDPKNAAVWAEMANTYDAMGLTDRSNETWRKVQELGPAAGNLFAEADKRLKIGVTSAAGATPALTPGATLDADAMHTNADGIQDGSTFGISEVKATETPDPDADTNLMLRIGVKKRPNIVTDHTKVKIQVFFYDTVDDKDIKLTDAEVNYEWLTPNHDWVGANPEVLAVTYVRGKNKTMTKEAELAAAAAAVVPGKKNRPAKVESPAPDAGRRKYLGYIVRIYYNDKLQAFRAEPTKLVNLFPPPLSLSSP